jgi:hypothetical protein
VSDRCAGSAQVLVGDMANCQKEKAYGAAGSDEVLWVLNF